MITLDEYKKLMFVNKGEWKPSDKTKWKEITVGSDKLYTCDIDNYELKSTKELVKNMQKCNEFEEKTDENYRKYYVENYDTKPIYKVLKYTDGKNEFVSYTKYSIGIQFKTNIKNELKKQIIKNLIQKKQNVNCLDVTDLKSLEKFQQRP